MVLDITLLAETSGIDEAFRGIDESQKSIELCRIRSRKTDIVIGPWRRLAVLSA
jgi:hypothetical protein